MRLTWDSPDTVVAVTKYVHLLVVVAVVVMLIYMTVSGRWDDTIFTNILAGLFGIDRLTSLVRRASDEPTG